MTKEVKASLPFCQLESPLVDKDICGRFLSMGVGVQGGSNWSINFGPGGISGEPWCGLVGQLTVWGSLRVQSVWVTVGERRR